MDEKAKKQLERFKQAAKKTGCDQSDDALDRAFGRLEPKQPPKEKTKKKPAK